MSDRVFMQRALQLAALGEGGVEPNPMVGAVIVQQGKIVGEGYHQKFGQPHAEVFALRAAVEAARGATLYVTLEPCCHFGKTPPCSEAVLAAGLARVVVAMADPFPRVAGGGLAQLRHAGIEVEVGLCEEQARRLNAPYLKRLSTGKPWVIAKWAMTLDGKIATSSGDSKWISNDASRRQAHGIRARVDAILVGSGTVLADDPMLTARVERVPRIATRVVLDRRGRTPLDCALVRTAREVPVIVFSHQQRPDLQAAGCEVLAMESVTSVLEELGRRQMSNLLIEGGAQVLGSFFDAGEVDEVRVWIAGKVVGGMGPSPVAGLGVGRIAEAYGFELAMETVEGDVSVIGRRHR
jgi:diaminohydroxyphosphoribosylaminopyrimidine deaminase/5-amino-6-(5-phosphoribosylamino)uracil reductase